MKKSLLLFLTIWLLCMVQIVLANNLCRQAQQFVRLHQHGLLAVLLFRARQTTLYSNSVYYSFNCHTYHKQFTTYYPAVVQSPQGFCAVLPSQEMKIPGIRCIRFISCIKQQHCKTTTLKLTWNNHLARYTEATPNIVKIDFLSHPSQQINSK